MSLDIREHLQADLLAHSGVAETALGYRPQASPLPALVYRCTHGEDDEDLDGACPTHKYHFEIVIWAATIAAAVAIKNTLVTRYHGTEDYSFGGRAADVPNGITAVNPLNIDSSRKLDEYDGDRVADTYSDNGAVALTLVFEFQWIE